MADIFDEVNEDLRADRARRFAAQYGSAGFAFVLLAVAGVAGWQVWHTKHMRETDAVATEFLTATHASPSSKAGPAATDPAAMATLDRLAATGPDGYRTLARLRTAAVRAGDGDLPAALGLWDQVAADQSADPLLRELATLLWAQHQVDAGPPDQVEARLQTLLAPDGPYRALALEARAWLLMRTGDNTQARDILQGLTKDSAVPEGVRGRANGLLARMGDPAAAGAQ